MNEATRHAIKLAHLINANLIEESIEDLQAGLELLQLSRYIPELREYKYKQYNKWHFAVPSKSAGWIALVSGGRDCDGVVSEGHVAYIKADVSSMVAAIEALHEGAEGPVWYHWQKPSLAAGVQQTSRDLTLEAFEDGHSHILYV